MEKENNLLIFKSPLDMKANLVEKDITFYKFWKDINLYKKLSSRNSEEFYLHDGPPYANGRIHMGHALNKILKDIIVRYNALLGKKVSWKFGWDTHGLPIELAIQKKYPKLKEESEIFYLDSCRDFALEQVNLQKDQFKKLNLLTDYSNYYLTLDKKYEEKEVELFFKLLNKKIVFKDFKPIYWSWSSVSALADAEIEYKDVETDSIYVSFKLDDSNLNLIIWTTTPWTLPVNKAIAVSSKITYTKFKWKNKQYIVSTKRLDFLRKKIEGKIEIIDNNFDIKKIVNKKYQNPINNLKSIVVYGDHVTDDSGTGIVHIAGGHGVDDFNICKNNNLEIIVGVNEKGIQINSDKYNGEFYLKNNLKIITDLKTADSLIHSEKIVHSTTIDWRTKKEVIYRATEQWFITIEKEKNKIISLIKDVDFVPKWGKEKLSNMIELRKDWCISRQRLWGLPIPIIYDEKNEVIVNVELQNKIRKIFLEEGSVSWWKHDIKYFLPDSIEYNENFKKETDTLDIWFDSGSSFTNENKISDIYLEGSDQYRGWFNSSLINSYFLNKRSPFKKVITHGFVVDGKGLKMSKSVGNVVDPENLLKTLGSDILKLWVANSDFTDSIKISQDLLKQVSLIYKKIRNTFKFILANLVDFDKEFKIDNSLSNIFISSFLDNVTSKYKNILNEFEKFNFKKVLSLVMNEINGGSISYFLEYSKDILYTKKSDSYERREVQFCLNYVLEILNKVLAPIIPVTMEEVYQLMNSEKKSIFESKFIKPLNIKQGSWKDFNFLKNEVNLKIEKLREEKKIKRSQEVDLEIVAPEKYVPFLKLKEINEILMVSTVLFSIGKSISIKSKKTPNEKCDRCWKHYPLEKIKNNICFECLNIIKSN